MVLELEMSKMETIKQLQILIDFFEEVNQYLDQREELYAKQK